MPRTSDARVPRSERGRVRSIGGPSPFTTVFLPCLRCGQLSVPVVPLFLYIGQCASTFPCRSCEAQHYLAVAREDRGFTVCYQRYTLRYPLEYYDEGSPPIVTFHVDGKSGS